MLRNVVEQFDFRCGHHRFGRRFVFNIGEKGLTGLPRIGRTLRGGIQRTVQRIIRRIIRHRTRRLMRISIREVGVRI